MSTSSIREEEVFICPLCNVENRAAAKYCRRCGISRTVLSTYVTGSAQPLVKPAAGAQDLDITTSDADFKTVPMTKPWEEIGVLPAAVSPSSVAPVQTFSENLRAAVPSPSTAPGSGETATASTGFEPSVSDAKSSQFDPDGSDLKSTASEPTEGNAAPAPTSQSVPGESPQLARPLSNAVAGAPDIEFYVSPECPGCHSSVRTTDRFCCWCGENQPQRDMPLLKICSQCSQRLPGRANYCFVCGANVGAGERLRIRVPTELFKEENSEFFPTFEA